MEETPDQPQKKSEFEEQLRPASEWYEAVEICIQTLSNRREELRHHIYLETRQRESINPKGEVRLSHRTARQLAKAEVFGSEWRKAIESIRVERQRVISVRKQLRMLKVQSRALEESSWWPKRIVQSWYQAFEKRSLEQRLKQANRHRRSALVTLRALRSDCVKPEVRSRLFALTESFLLKDERLAESIKSLKEAEQKISSSLSDALRISPQLRDLGNELVPMRQHTDEKLQMRNPPTPVGPILAPNPARKPHHSIRTHTH